MGPWGISLPGTAIPLINYVLLPLLLIKVLFFFRFIADAYAFFGSSKFNHMNSFLLPDQFDTSLGDILLYVIL